jgi:hypothetical protein
MAQPMLPVLIDLNGLRQAIVTQSYAHCSSRVGDLYMGCDGLKGFAQIGYARRWWPAGRLI